MRYLKYQYTAQAASSKSKMMMLSHRNTVARDGRVRHTAVKRQCLLAKHVVIATIKIEGCTCLGFYTEGY